MKYKWILSFILVCSALPLFSQTITVIDNLTAQPITNVAIYSVEPSLSVITNPRGQANITVFKEADSIYIQHVSYEIKVLNFEQLSSESIILLTPVNFSLDEVVISANRWEQQNKDIPHRIQKITQRDILFHNPQTAADLLAAGGYAYIQKSQMAGGSPILRGFSTNRVLLVVDGVRMNNAIFRTGNLQNVISLDALSIQSNEILFGPGAVIYGSDAIGGVMDFHTLDPLLTTNGKAIVTGNAIARFSSAAMEKTGHVNFNIGLKKWAFRTAITYSDFDDLKTGKNGDNYFLRPEYQTTINGRDTVLKNSDPQKQVASGYDQFNLLQRIKFKPNDKLELDYGFYFSETTDAPRYDRLYLKNGDGDLVNAEWYYGPQKWIMNRLSAKVNDETALYDAFRIDLSHQFYQESRHDRKMNNSRLRNQYEKVNALAINADFDKVLNDNLTLFYGVEGIHNKVGSTANRTNIFTGEESPTNTRYPDGSTWQSYSLYTNFKIDLAEQWIINAGARFNYIALEADFDTTMFPFPFTHASLSNGAMNGSLGIVWSPKKNLRLYTNLSTGFRSPNIDDLGKVFDSEPGTVVVPNANLKPEYAWNAEIGTAYTYSNKLKADLSVYYTLLDNALARRDFSYNGVDSLIYDGILSKVEAIQNITQAYVYGVQAGVEFIPYKGFRVSSKLSYQYGREQSEDSLIYYPLRHSVPLFGNTHIYYEQHKLLIDLYAEYNAGLSYDDLPLSERADSEPYAKDDNGLPYVPRWYTLNLKASWFVNKNFSVNAGVENITNQLYRPFASGISAPGRNFILSIKASF